MDPINLLEYWIGIYNGYRGIFSDTKFETELPGLPPLDHIT